MRGTLLSILSVAGVLGLTSVANGTTVLFDNVGDRSSGYDSIADNTFLADSFSTGSSSFVLKDITVLIDGVSADGGFFTISVMSDSSNHPGLGVVATTGPISDSELHASLTAETFALSALLSPDTRYWIEITHPKGDTTSLNWSYSFDPSGVESGQYYSNQDGAVFMDNSGPYQMDIATPEAPEWAMLLAGFGGLGAVFRRRSRSQLA